MATIQVRILEPWNGYKANSILTVTETTYYQTRADGVQMHIVAESKPLKKEPLNIETLHDRPFIIEEEE